MPTACTLDALEITAARPGDPRSKYFAELRLRSRCEELFRRMTAGRRRRITADNLVKELTMAADQEQLQVDLGPMPIEEKSSTLREVLKIS